MQRNEFALSIDRVGSVQNGSIERARFVATIMVIVVLLVFGLQGTSGCLLSGL